MRKKTRTLTEQELEIMKIVWEQEHATVRDVYEALLKRRKVAYTMVMTVVYATLRRSSNASYTSRTVTLSRSQTIFMISSSCPVRMMLRRRILIS